MARTLRITDGTTTIDLLGGDYQLERGGWSTRTTRDARTWETFILVSNAADADIRETQIDIDILFETARDFDANILESTPVWLEFRSDGELQKRALVYDGETELKADDCFTPGLGAGGMRLTIALQRDRAWENDSSNSDSEAAVNNLGGTWVIGNDAGSLDQRISKFTMTSTGFSQAKVWAGIRDIRNGTTGFISLWEMESGGAGTDTATAVDATASPGSGSSKLTCTFATTATMARRSAVAWEDIQTSANWDDIVGSYLVLGRLKLDALTTEVAVQLQCGWTQLGSVGTIVGTTYLSAVDDANLVEWNLIELGYVDIPTTGNRDSVATSADDVKKFRLDLFAERISVAGSLDMDCFILIPSEHLYTVKSTVAFDFADAFTGPDGYQYALGKDGTTYGNVDYTFTDWYYPVGGGIMVIASQETTLSRVLSATTNLAITLYPRWKTYREQIST